MKRSLLSILALTLLMGCNGPSTSSPDAASTSPVAKTAAVEMTPVQRGAKIYARCRACHTLEQGGGHKVGPNLWDIYGAQAGSKEGFAYSKAMKAANIVWNEETLDGYLKRPSAFMPGNKMTFIGLKKQEDRDAVQAFMKAKTTP